LAFLFQKSVFSTLSVCLFLLLVGCGDKAKDLYNTAQLEEKQFNKPPLRNFTDRS
jgi:hypothetical protein